MTRHLLVGSLGGPNFGDEAIFYAWVRAIQERSPAAEVFCDGFDLETLERCSKDRATVLSSEQSIWSFVRMFAGLETELPIWEYIEREFARDHVSAELEIRIAALEQMNIDIIHVIGGGYFNNLWPANYVILKVARLVAGRTGAHLVATGLGLVPTCGKDHQGLLEVLSGFGHVDVRDKESFLLLSGLEGTCVTFSGDDALIFFDDNKISYPLNILEQPAVILCLQNDLYNGNAMASSLLTDEFFDILREHEIRDIIYTIATPSDVERPSVHDLKKIENAGFHSITIGPFSLLERGFPVSENGMVITSRYHPHLLCSLAGFSGVALSSMAYYDTKHAAVQNMGSNWPVLGREYNLSNFPKSLSELWENKGSVYRPEARDRFCKLKHDIVSRILSL